MWYMGASPGVGSCQGHYILNLIQYHVNCNLVLKIIIIGVPDIDMILLAGQRIKILHKMRAQKPHI